MRTKLYVTLTLFAVVLAGCVKPKSDAPLISIPEEQQMFNVTKEGQLVTVDVLHNGVLTVTIPVGCQYWISEVGSRGRTTSSVALLVQPNLSTSTRTGIIVLSVGALNREVKISQDPSPVKLPGKLTSFKFEKAKNPQLSKDLEMTILPNNVIFGYPANDISLTSLIPTFTVEHGTVVVGGKDQLSGQTAQDFSSSVSYLIVGEDQSRQTFKVNLMPYTGLPVAIFTTDGGKELATEATSRTEWIPAKVTIDGMGQFSDYTGSLDLCREGYTTFGFAKKPFTVKLDAAASLLNMPQHKQWTFLANWRDRTLLRNDAVFHLGALCNGLGWTPKSQFVEVVYNGVHLGNYQLTEHVQVDANAVNITEMKTGDVSGSALTGGYLLLVDGNYDLEPKFKSTPGNLPVMVKSPVEEPSRYIAPQQLEYIKNYIEQIEADLNGNNYEAVYTLLDKTSFIDFWLVNALVGNVEITVPANYYMYKKRDGKLYAGPLWGFDFSSFATAAEYEQNWASRSTILKQNPLWFSRLLKDPEFAEAAKARFTELKSEFQKLPGYIDQQSALIQKSEKVNTALWPIKTSTLGANLNGDETLTHQEAVARMKAMYNARLQALRNYLNNGAWE